jgi:hypothetical protein
VLRLKCPAWRVAILCSDLRLLQNTGLRLDVSLAWVNGGACQVGARVVPADRSAPKLAFLNRI